MHSRTDHTNRFLLAAVVTAVAVAAPAWGLVINEDSKLLANNGVADDRVGLSIAIDKSVVAVEGAEISTGSGSVYVLGGGPEQCAGDDECGDGDDCTTDVCDPADPDADASGCVNTCVPRLFGDIVPVFCPPSCFQPDMDDILCTIDGFTHGANWADVCPGGDLDPCGVGDGDLDMDDILKVLDAFGGNAPCPDPCTCP